MDNHLRSNARILCLDDGGVRVLSSLDILDRLIIRINCHQVSCQEGCRPSLHFDLICGSGWGGLVAILLGRLGLTLAECKDWLLDIGPKLEPVKSSFSIFSCKTNLEENNRALHEAMKSLLRKFGYDQEELFSSQPHSHGCRTMVLTMHPGNIRLPVRLRSYTSRSNPVATKCTVWQATIATMATPTRYVAEKFGTPPVPHISAGIGYGNPAKEGLDEAVRVWQLSAIDCIVSIGTGLRPSIRFDKEIRYTGIRGLFDIISFISILTDVATDYDRVHNDLNRDAKMLGLKYFRFSVRDVLADIAMQDWHRASDISTATSAYVREDDANLIMCASYLENSYATLVGQLDAQNVESNPTSCERSLYHYHYCFQLPDGCYIKNCEAETTVANSRQDNTPRSLYNYQLTSPQEGNQISVDGTTVVQLFDAVASVGDIDTNEAADQWFRDLHDRTQGIMGQRRRSNDKKVKVAILDTGINMDSSGITNYQRQVKMQEDFTGSTAGMRDEVGHGTNSAALLFKVAPNADLYIAKVVASRTTTNMTKTKADIAEAIKRAVDTWDVDIISMSFGSRYESDEILDALDYAYQKKKILFAAASNEGSRNSRPAFPGRNRAVLCIHSANGWGKPSDYNPPAAGNEDNFSVLGEGVAISADDINRLRGTSIATPIAAGIAALILELLCQGQSGDWRIQRPERLWTYAGMRNIFLAMSSESQNYAANGYHFVQPWVFVNDSKGRDHVMRDISYRMQNL